MSVEGTFVAVEYFNGNWTGGSGNVEKTEPISDLARLS